MAEETPFVPDVEKDPFAQLLGINLISLEPGHSVVGMTLRGDMLNFHGVAHGGAVFALADASFALASNSQGAKAVALNVSVTYLSAATAGAKLIAEAVARNVSRRIGLYDLTVRTEEGQLIASLQGLAYRMG